MTSLPKDAPQQGEDLWLVLLHEVTYWRGLPEIQEDPGSFALADRSWTRLQEVTPRTEASILEEVRLLMQQLARRVREKRLLPLAVTEEPPPPSTVPRRKKKKRRGKGETTAPMLFLGACSLVPEGADTDAIAPFSPAVYYKSNEWAGIYGIRESDLNAWSSKK